MPGNLSPAGIVASSGSTESASWFLVWPEIPIAGMSVTVFAPFRILLTVTGAKSTVAFKTLPGRTLRSTTPLSSTSCGSVRPGSVPPNKVLELTGRHIDACQALQPPAARFGGRFVGRPPVGAWYLHGRPAAERRSVRRLGLPAPRGVEPGARPRNPLTFGLAREALGISQPMKNQCDCAESHKLRESIKPLSIRFAHG